MKKLLSIIVLSSICLSLPLTGYAEKPEKNTKKLNQKKIFREEHRTVLGWGSIYGKLYAKKKRMKKKFQ